MSFEYESQGRSLEAPDGFAWLFEIEVPTPTPRRLRITSNNEIVTFGESLAGARVTYQPWPLRISQISRQTKGDLPNIGVTVSNAKRSLPDFLERYDGFVGQPAVVQLISLGETLNASAGLRFDGDVVGSEVSPEQVTFTIGSYSLKGSQFPKQRFVAEHCRFIFGSAQCGYNVNHPLATYTTCPRTYEACNERGEDEENVMDVIRNHPERFGGWRGIPLG